MLGPIIAIASALGGGGLVALLSRRWRAKSPRGKGVFIRSVRHADSPAKLADLCAAMGLSWVCISLIIQLPNGRQRQYPMDDLAAACRELDARGIDVWLWAWPEPGRAQQIVDRYRLADEATGRCKIHGLILDPEQPYYSGRMEAQSEIDVQKLRELGVPLGCTSYGGGPPNHPSFPWKPWARGTDFGMPQIYDAHERLSSKYPARAVEYWQDAGWKTIVPVWAAYDKTPEQMREMIARTPEVYRGACWWDFYWLERSSKRRDVVAEFEIPRQKGKRVKDGRIA